MPPAKAPPPTEPSALIDHLKINYQAAHRTMRNCILLEPSIDSCTANLKTLIDSKVADLSKVMQSEIDLINGAEFNLNNFDSRMKLSSSQLQTLRRQYTQLAEYKDFVVGCKNRTILVIGETFAPPGVIIKKKCCVCLDMVADVDSLVCRNGCHNCYDCLFGEIATRRSDQHKLFFSKNAFKCFECNAEIATSDVIMRLAEAANVGPGGGGSTSASGSNDRGTIAARAAVALKDVLYCEGEIARGDSRLSAIRDYRKRAAEKPLDKLNRICDGLYCPSCDALYDQTTEGMECMHADCSMCFQKFCGFCFSMDCEAATCRLNPSPGSVYSSNKACATAVCKALQIATLLKDYDCRERITLLDSIENRIEQLNNDAAAAAENDTVATAVLFVDSPSLYEDPFDDENLRYAGPRVLNELHKVYGGKNGTDLPAVDYNSIRVGDWVIFTEDTALIKRDIQHVGAYRRTNQWQPLVEHAAALASTDATWQVVTDGTETNADIITVMSSATFLKIDVYFEWIEKHIPFDTIFKTPDPVTLSAVSISSRIDGTKCPVADAKAELFADNTELFVGDWVFIGKTADELKAIYSADIVITARPGYNGVFGSPGWHPQYKHLSGKWHYIANTLTTGKYKVVLNLTAVVLPPVAVTHFIRSSTAQIAAAFVVSGFIKPNGGGASGAAAS